MQSLKYLANYSQEIRQQVQELIDADRLGERLLAKYPDTHNQSTDKALYDYVQLEFEVRLYLTYLDRFGELYSRTNSTSTS
ncbi:MAG: hypothetical protein JHC35_00600 [Sulfuricurvum sp.]|jgi:hypothetical protein|uniref:hypothetical protein n=1 Tax=Sulfuricurvum sp. TaxID=2025608 RepID=UPI0025DF522D|nr:hypothetical protein [Sulfuricurvum sp.]MCI4405765.1 hypothetical protein [Sulfuricurvum sp.]